MLEKAYIAVKRLLKSKSGEGLRRRTVIEKASISLENIQMVINRILVEIWMVKAIMMRSQIEMSSPHSGVTFFSPQVWL